MFIIYPIFTRHDLSTVVSIRIIVRKDGNVFDNHSFLFISTHAETEIGDAFYSVVNGRWQRSNWIRYITFVAKVTSFKPIFMTLSWHLTQIYFYLNISKSLSNKRTLIDSCSIFRPTNLTLFASEDHNSFVIDPQRVPISCNTFHCMEKRYILLFFYCKQHPQRLLIEVYTLLSLLMSIYVGFNVV